jgi:hypothetical protein
MSSEPCGSLPVTHGSISVSYCHHHLAWHLTALRFYEEGDDDMRRMDSCQRSYGPFDSQADIYRDVVELVARFLVPPT